MCSRAYNKSIVSTYLRLCTHELSLDIPVLFLLFFFLIIRCVLDLYLSHGNRTSYVVTITCHCRSLSRLSVIDFDVSSVNLRCPASYRYLARQTSRAYILYIVFTKRRCVFVCTVYVNNIVKSV